MIMMTENEFYKKKIFYSESIIKIRKEHKNQKNDIDLWYRSDRYVELQEIKNKFNTKLNQLKERDKIKLKLEKDSLYEMTIWYLNADKECRYCKLPQSELTNLHTQPGHINKRWPKRGQELEIDRMQSDLPYTDIENLTLACYWCNNGKTDTFTFDEAIEIGKSIQSIWEKRLNKKFKNG
jgi:hypothetical protein